MNQPVNHRALARKALIDERKAAAETDKLGAETSKLRAETRKLDAEAFKLNAEQDKLLVERRKTSIEALRSALTLSALLASSFGFATVFFYCFSYIHYFPTGLTVSDTAFFLFIVLALGFFGAGISVIGYLLYLPWVLAEDRAEVAKKTAAASNAASTPDNAPRDPFFSRFCFAVACLMGAVLFIGYGIAAHSVVFDIVGGALSVVSVALTISYWRKRAVHRLDIYAALVPQLSLAAFAVVLVSHIDDVGTALCLLAAPVAGGFLLALAVRSLTDALDAEKPDSSRKRSLKLLITCSAFASVAPLFYLHAALPGGLPLVVMRSLGAYSDDPGLLVNADNLAKLRAVADSEGAFLYSCQEADDTTLVSNVRVWWHGVGTGTYVEVLPTGSAQQSDDPAKLRFGQAPAINGALVELESKGVQIVKGHVGKCVEIPNSLVFASNRVNIQGHQKTAAELALTALKNKAQSGDSFLLTGHADSMPTHQLSNYDLSLQRACGVYRLFAETKPQVPQEHVWVDAQGALRPIKNCDGVKDLAEKRECLTSNRRVTVRVIPGFGGPADNGWQSAEDACKPVPPEPTEIQTDQKTPVSTIKVKG